MESASQKTSKRKRKYPDSLLSDMVEYFVTGYGNEGWTEAKEASMKLDTTDVALADYLLSMLNQPHRDILLKFYKENKTCAAIGKEYGVGASYISAQKRYGVRVIRSRWMNHGCPLSVDDLPESVRTKEQKISPDSAIAELQPSTKIVRTLYQNNLDTLSDLLAVEDARNLCGIGHNGSAYIEELKQKAIQLLRENGYEV